MRQWRKWSLIDAFGALGRADAVDGLAGDRDLMARTLALLFAVGGALGAITLVLPGDPARNTLALWGLVAAALGVAATCEAAGDLLPRWALDLVPATGTVLSGAAMVFAGPTAAVAYGAFLFWVTLVAFQFLDLRRAYAHAVCAALVYAAALLVQPGTPHVALYLAMGAGSILVTGTLMGLLRSRADTVVHQLASAATTDPLTGLANRRAFDHELRREVERAKRSGRQVGLILFDLDRLKEINDNLGHQAGDQALRKFGQILTECLREIDGLARLGGDEFAAIVPEAGETETYLIAERVRQAVDLANATAAEERMTVSAGICVYPKHGEDPARLHHQADMALYTAKQLGRDRTAIYGAQATAAVTAEDDEAEARRGGLSTLISLAEFVDHRHHGGPEHAQRVARYAEAIGRSLGLDATTVEQLRLAGLLHDIGKIGVSTNVIGTAGDRRPDEVSEVHRHPQIGARIVRNAGLDEISGWIAAHHERPDGLGYPAGLGGDQVPVGARVLGVAEAYDAMTTDRGYRRAMSSREACEELLAGAGRQFYPEVVDALVALLEQREERRRIRIRPLTGATT